MHRIDPYVAEFIGTTLLVLLGDGVVANVVLNRTKGRQGGWVVITLGWAMAVFVGVLCAQEFSGAHLNPAVSLGLAWAGKFAWAKVPGYVAAQVLGGFAGAALVLLFYYAHFKVTDDVNSKLAVFCTGPEIRGPASNFFSELLGTFVLVFVVLFIAAPTLDLVNAPDHPLLVLAIGLSLGGTTGYAINPARDLGPRLAHALLPVPAKRDSDWSYAWVPVLGPLAGGLAAAMAHAMLS